MHTASFSAEIRTPRTLKLQPDLVVIGGGLSGVCASITAARAGISVVLVQDRPVLGGNASSEVRLWILGATSHMGNNNRWAREGGVIDEILVENLFRNREGNPLILDTILLEKVSAEPNITLLLNTQVFELEKDGDMRIKSVRAFCSQNSTMYELEAPYFCDASGDGIAAFLAGAPFRMGAEKAEEFGEGFAPDVEDYGELLGHSIYFYTKDTGRPVKYVAPSFALQNAGELPRLRSYKLQDHGCRLWWVEYGGRLDTIHQSEDIKWELWKVIYGIWDYVKNSGEFPESENLTLEWVGTVPGKRESRRFEGEYMLTQADIVEQRYQADAVAFGGWAMDLHPADGVYSDKLSCNQWHSKGVYSIPYRCFYSRSIENLFLAGRIISASHVAFGSSRVMATCAHGAQAVGMAAAICKEKGLQPAAIYHEGHMPELQQRLNLIGQSIQGVPLQQQQNLLASAKIEASSTLRLSELPFDGPWMSLAEGVAQLLPMKAGELPSFTLQVKAQEAGELTAQICIAEKQGNYVPDQVFAEQVLGLEEGEQEITLNFEASLAEDQYIFLLLVRSDKVEVKATEQRITGLLSVFNSTNKAVANYGKQEPPQGLGIESFPFWIPKRRPEGHSLAIRISPALEAFEVDNLGNGYVRPYIQSNAWVADPNDSTPSLRFSWEHPQELSEIRLFWDSDYDHPMESALMGHPEDRVPFCVEDYQILYGQGQVLYEKKGNYQSLNIISLETPIRTQHLEIRLQHPPRGVASLFDIFMR